MAYFNEFPHTRTYDSDLGWLIAQMKKLIEEMDTFTSFAAIKFADPIEWSITRSYEVNTIVMNGNDSYVSKKPVPAGVNITDTDYWMQIGNFSASIQDLYDAIDILRQDTADAIADINNDLTALDDDIDGIAEDVAGIDTAYKAADAVITDRLDDIEDLPRHYYAETVNAMTQIDARTIDTITTMGFYSAGVGGGTYKITASGTANGHTVIALTNGRYANLITEDAGDLRLEQIGAYGDGVHDDTAAINFAFQNAALTHGAAGAVYLISSTLTLPYGHSFDGNESTIRTVSFNDFAAAGITGLPTKIAIFVQGREPVGGSEKEGYTKYIRNLRLIEYNTDTDITGSNHFCGIYLGYKNALPATAATVNYSVFGYTFDNIAVYGFDMAFYLAECWETVFNDIHARNFYENGFRIYGQSVNDAYSNCILDGRNGSNTVAIDINVNPNYSKRPEGQMFTNMGIFSCNYGVRLITGLSITITNSVIDLHENSAIYVTIGDLFISNSWISSKTGASQYQVSQATVLLNSVGSASAGNKVTLNGCHIVNRNDNNGTNPGAVMQGNNRYADIVENCMCEGSVRQLNSTAALRIINNSFIAGNTIYTVGDGVRSGNYIAATGEALN